MMPSGRNAPFVGMDVAPIIGAEVNRAAHSWQPGLSQ